MSGHGPYKNYFAMRHSAGLKTHNTALGISRAILHILVLHSLTNKRLFYM